MSTLQVTFDGRNYTFAPGATVRIGRSSENDVVINDPTVSRRHAFALGGEGARVRLREAEARLAALSQYVEEDALS